MGTATKKPHAKRSKKSGVKNFIRTHKNTEIIQRLLKELKK